MKPRQALTALAIVFLLISAATQTAHAHTEVFTHNEGDKAQLTADGTSVFACGTTMSIETEPEGGWLPNKTYQVNWTLSLDYVNSEILNGSNFYILFAWPPLEKVTPTIPAEIVVNETQLSLAHKTGTISTSFTPTDTSDGFFMNPEFPFAVYVNDEVLGEEWASGTWYGYGAVSNNVIDPDATPILWPPTATAEFPTLPVIIGVTVGTLFAFCALMVVRKRRVPESVTFENI